jgi:Pyridoxamine 5'-phosphate oxidase
MAETDPCTHSSREERLFCQRARVREMRVVQPLSVLRDHISAQEKVWKMSRLLSGRESEFLKANYVARVATASSESVPRVSPVYFANDAASIYFTTETSTGKFRDISENPRASLVIDTFDADWLHGNGKSTKTYEKGIVLIGKAEIHWKGNLYMDMYRDLVQKYPDYQGPLRWEPGDLPIIRVEIKHIVSWRLD